MSNQRIAVNTAATYTRAVLAGGLSLFSSRWVLSALGQTDYGIFFLVGSIIIFITFLNAVMAFSAARYFAFSIGQGVLAEVNNWFNSALGMHICLAFFLVLVGWPIGEYCIGHILTVPSERIAASLWVFRISLVSAFVSMLSVPFIAMFTAKQHIAELAAWGILQSILTFTLALFLNRASGDRLLVYAAGMVIILVFVQVAQIFRAMAVFNECSISCQKWFDRYRFKCIFYFASWNLIGSCGALFRNQGSAILLNLFFGPSVNAAYGIATQLSNQTNQFSAAMIGAFSPEINACEGRGDRARMLSLSQRASKFGTILVLLFAIPLIIEMNYVLNLWLREPPLYTALFCQLILGTFLIDRLSTGYNLAVNAYGKIAAYQAIIGTIQLLTLPLGYLFLKIGLAPTSIGIATIVTMAITAVGNVLWGRYLFRVPVLQWLTVVVWPISIIILTTSTGALVFHWLLPASFLRLLIVTATSVVVNLLTAWFFAMDLNERDFAGQNVCRFLNKFRNRGPLIK